MSLQLKVLVIALDLPQQSRLIVPEVLKGLLVLYEVVLFESGVILSYDIWLIKLPLIRSQSIKLLLQLEEVLFKTCITVLVKLLESLGLKGKKSGRLM